MKRVTRFWFAPMLLLYPKLFLSVVFVQINCAGGAMGFAANNHQKTSNHNEAAGAVSTTTTKGMPESLFVTKYLDRMGLDPAMFNNDPSTPIPRNFDLLCRLMEAHLCTIPFENLAQHGGYGGPVQLNLNWMIDKILDRRRGGFCLELNTLFANLLKAFGFHVVIVPAIVYKDDQGGFDHPATHIILIVTLPDDGDSGRTNGMKYFVDVGFGEPPCNPLFYEFGTEQVTSEGMKSRLIVDTDGDENGHRVVLEWFKDNEWRPRLQWFQKDTITPAATTGSSSQTIERFQPMLDLIYDPNSIFSRKLIVCRLTKDQKLTLAGNKFKITGPPRCVTTTATSNDTDDNVKITHVVSIHQLQEILANQFGIALGETDAMDLVKIKAQDPNLFSHF